MAWEHERLEYLRGELRAERISYGELAELQSLIPYIDPSDVELLEASGTESELQPEPLVGLHRWQVRTQRRRSQVTSLKA